MGFVADKVVFSEYFDNLLSLKFQHSLISIKLSLENGQRGQKRPQFVADTVICRQNKMKEKMKDLLETSSLFP